MTKNFPLHLTDRGVVDAIAAVPKAPPEAETNRKGKAVEARIVLSSRGDYKFRSRENKVESLATTHRIIQQFIARKRAASTAKGQPRSKSKSGVYNSNHEEHVSKSMMKTTYDPLCTPDINEPEGIGHEPNATIKMETAFQPRPESNIMVPIYKRGSNSINKHGKSSETGKKSHELAVSQLVKGKDASRPDSNTKAKNKAGPISIFAKYAYIIQSNAK